MGTYGSDIQSAVAVQIKVELALRDWKQSDLAAASGIPTSTLSRYMKGERDIPLPVFVDLAGALGMSVSELAERAQRRLKGEDVS